MSGSMNPGLQSQISSQTSDPSTAHMRVFVGNLNTTTVDKGILQEQFAKYGPIAAISIHRGFAFIQYNNPNSARNAVQGEHGSLVAGQKIDINIAAEPKPNQKPQGFNSGGSQNFGSNTNGSFTNMALPQGPRMSMRGMRGAVRGMRGTRGRGMMARGRGSGMFMKVQTGRVEKSQYMKRVMKSPYAAQQMYPSDTQGGPDWDAIYNEVVDIRDRLNVLIDQMDGNAEGEGLDMEV